MNTPISALLERKGGVVHAVSPSTSVVDAVSEMNRHRIGCIVVLEGNWLAGIFTERDILRRFVSDGAGLRTVRVAEVMTTDVITIPPDATVEDAMALFTEKRCRHLPVVSAGKLLGLISIGDISRWLVEMHRVEAEHLKNYIAGGYGV